MAKRKKKITEGQLNEKPIKVKNSLIQDTSADPMLLNLEAKEEGKTPDGLLTLHNQFPPRTNNTYSFRISGDLVDHFKEQARIASARRNEDINWQRLVIGAALEKYPVKEKK